MSEGQIVKSEGWSRADFGRKALRISGGGLRKRWQEWSRIVKNSQELSNVVRRWSND